MNETFAARFFLFQGSFWFLPVLNSFDYLLSVLPDETSFGWIGLARWDSVFYQKNTILGSGWSIAGRVSLFYIYIYIYIYSIYLSILLIPSSPSLSLIPDQTKSHSACCHMSKTKVFCSCFFPPSCSTIRFLQIVLKDDSMWTKAKAVAWIMSKLIIIGITYQSPYSFPSSAETWDLGTLGRRRNHESDEVVKSLEGVKRYCVV